MLLLYVYIAVGGGAGAIARFALGGWVQGWAGAEFPWGTLVVNLTGSLLLGFLVPFLTGVAARPELRAALTTGFCGGYTTFSTFSYESARLLQGGQWGRASGYMAASLVLALAGTLLGFRLAASLLARG